jgi:hypothetical protein
MSAKFPYRLYFLYQLFKYIIFATLLSFLFLVTATKEHPETLIFIPFFLIYFIPQAFAKKTLLIWLNKDYLLSNGISWYWGFWIINSIGYPMAAKNLKEEVKQLLHKGL